MPTKKGHFLYHSKRTPHELHHLEETGLLNNFYYNIDDTPEIAAILDSHTDITFLFIVDQKKQLILGIEIPFAQMQKLPEAKGILEDTLDALVDFIASDQKLQSQVEAEIKKFDPEFEFSSKDHIEELKDLLKDVFQKKKKKISKHLEVPNENYFGVMIRPHKLIKLISQYTKQGHPTLLQNNKKAGFVGGELSFQSGIWVLENKSGRYGLPSSSDKSDPISDFYINTAELLFAEIKLRENGVDNVITRIFEPKKSENYQDAEFINIAIEIYRQHGWDLKATKIAVLERAKYSMDPDDMREEIKLSNILSQAQDKIAKNQELDIFLPKLEENFPKEARFLEEIDKVHASLGIQSAPSRPKSRKPKA